MRNFLYESFLTNSILNLNLNQRKPWTSTSPFSTSSTTVPIIAFNRPQSKLKDPLTHLSSNRLPLSLLWVLKYLFKAPQNKTIIFLNQHFRFYLVTKILKIRQNHCTSNQPVMILIWILKNLDLLKRNLPNLW